jgi:hypothetical protein
MSKKGLRQSAKITLLGSFVTTFFTTKGEDSLIVAEARKLAANGWWIQHFRMN